MLVVATRVQTSSVADLIIENDVWDREKMEEPWEKSNSHERDKLRKKTLGLTVYTLMQCGKLECYITPEMTEKPQVCDIFCLFDKCLIIFNIFMGNLLQLYTLHWN